MHDDHDKPHMARVEETPRTLGDDIEPDDPTARDQPYLPQLDGLEKALRTAPCPDRPSDGGPLEGEWLVLDDQCGWPEMAQKQAADYRAALRERGVEADGAIARRSRGGWLVLIRPGR